MTMEGSSELAENKQRGEKEKGSRQRGQKKEKVKPQTKIVIRHLPPTMSEEEFLKQIDPLPDHDYYYWVSADWSLGYDATCRAYISLRDYNDVFLFRDRFDGYVFVDKHGAEYSAIVEFAPFQGMAKNKSRRSDNKVNTIEEEPHYQQFVEKLEEDREAAAKGCETKLEFTLDRKKEEKITSTPLLQYLANKKEKRREEAKKRTEEKRRQAQQQQHKVTKIISNQDAGAGCGGTSGGGTGGGGGNASKRDDKRLGSNAKNETAEEKKNSRVKRRLERNQRRREAHEQRQQDRDRDRKEKGANSGDAEQSDASKTDPKLSETQQQQQQQKKTDDSKQRKDSKKTSEKRDRNRNRKDKEKSKPKETTSLPSVLLADKSVADLNKSPDGEVSETVINFIRAAAATRNSEPHAKNADEQVSGQGQDSNVNKDNIQKTIDHAEPSTVEAPTNEVRQTKSGRLQNNRKSADSSGSKTITEEERQRKRQRAADEQRRIRNKDRPSIAIYQPKPRQRQSEERDVAVERKDARSNPTSDCESVKKEDNHNRKVSRYSERRSQRRAPVKLGKAKSVDDDSGPQHELRKSESGESSSVEPKSETAKPNNENGQHSV